MNNPKVARRLVLAVACVVAFASGASAQTVQITQKPVGLVSGALQVPVVATAPVERLELFINGVRHSAAAGQRLDARVNVGYYIRRLRLRAVGYDAAGEIAGEDEMVVNDPRPPFRVRLQGPPAWPAAGTAELQATVLRPGDVPIAGVDFYVGEDKVATDTTEPYAATVDASGHPGAFYARVVARGGGDREAHDVRFFGDVAHGATDVRLQQIPVSVVGGGAPLRHGRVTLRDSGGLRPIEGVLPAGDEPLDVILLVDCSESMIEELPVVKAAALQFARDLLRPQDRIAVVGFNQRTWWLTGFTNDHADVAAAIDRIRPGGPTHLYDSVVEMLYEIQKRPGRQALVVLTDGADQGSRFELDHLVHYARYAGVPVYPVIKNVALSRWMKLGVGKLQARRIANIAEDTGATWFIVQREDELAGVYARIAAELRQQYRLVFHAEAEGGDRWHSIAVTSADGQKLRAPRGYFP